MADFFNKLFDTSDFPRRWECGDWGSFHGWLHILSDAAIWAAYAAIPLALGFYWWKKRRELAFGMVVLLFGAFILSCGTVHLLDAIIFYSPVYRLQGLVKFVTAAVSWATVVAIIRIAPRALDLPGLKAVNGALRVELDKRRTAEQTLAQAHEDLQSFTSLVTHDLRNSFGGALFMAELARENYRQGTRDEAADQLASVIDALKSIDESLKQYGRQTLAFEGGDTETISLAPVVEEARQGVAPLLRTARAKLTVGEMPVVRGRATMLVHLFSNLIENAIKYRSKAPLQIHIDSVAHGECIAVRVRDNGRGIPPEEADRIFQHGYRGTNAREQAGTGFGLAYCRRIMSAHGGRIDAAPNPDGGTTFTLTFPAPDETMAPDVPAADDNPELPPPPARPARP